MPGPYVQVIKHNIADALRGRGDLFAPQSEAEEPIDRLFRLVPDWKVSDELDAVFRAMVHRDPMQRPSANDLLECDWMRRAGEVTEAEVVAAFEQRRPVSEEEHNTMLVTCAPRLKDPAQAFDALVAALHTLEWPTQVRHTVCAYRSRRLPLSSLSFSLYSLTHFTRCTRFTRFTRFTRSNHSLSIVLLLRLSLSLAVSRCLSLSLAVSL